jgi:hypothetical protein
MVLEIIFNILLLFFSAFGFWYVGSTMPKSPASDLGAEQWPQTLFVLLIIAIAYNLYKFFKKHKKEELSAAFADFFPGIIRFVKSKLFIGMVMLVFMALIYETVGYFFTCLLLMIGYGILLGERRPVRLIVASLVITLVLYIGFSVFLGVLLPRGYIPFLRSISLFMESIFQWL